MYNHEFFEMLFNAFKTSLSCLERIAFVFLVEEKGMNFRKIFPIVRKKTNVIVLVYNFITIKKLISGLRSNALFVMPLSLQLLVFSNKLITTNFLLVTVTVM